MTKYVGTNAEETQKLLEKQYENRGNTGAKGDADSLYEYIQRNIDELAPRGSASITAEIHRDSLDVLDEVMDRINRVSHVLAHTEYTLQKDGDPSGTTDRFSKVSDIEDLSKYKEFTLQVRLQEVK